MEKIGEYELYLSKCLGKGSFSKVYMGKYVGQDTDKINKNTEIAIKVMKYRDKLTLKKKKIIDEEIKIMRIIKDLPHPNIIKCYDIIISEDEKVYIIMEYCDSGDLRKILQYPIREKYVRFYFTQLANGLKYLDNHNIIHRDIKPRNILLTKKRKVLKIADFGFAKKINNISLYDTICGSPLYMAPEIMKQNNYNNQTDLWSIGMILYEMLYGEHPYHKCKSVSELKKCISENEIVIPPKETDNTKVSIECIKLLIKLLKKDVNERITWSEFFNNSWINMEPYDEPINNDKNKEYENKICAISIGSLSSKENIDNLMNVPNNTPILKDSIEIIDGFCHSNYDSYTDYQDDHDNQDNHHNKDDNLMFTIELDD